MTFIANTDEKYCFKACDIHVVGRGECSCKNRGLTITIVKDNNETTIINNKSGD